MPPQDARITGLDLLRGLVIFMAVFEHYTGYLNYWYIDFFNREHALWDSFYLSHKAMAGHLLPMDNTTAQVSAWLIPWVSQIYLALAAFNLSRRSQERFRPQLGGKLVLFASIILILYVEGLVIAPNFGEAISFYPVMLWMCLLALFSLVYAWFGIRGMLVLTVLSLLLDQFGVQTLLGNIDSWMKLHVHPDYELDARLDLFMASGCFGFLYGWCWHQRPQWRDRLNGLVLTLSLIALVIYLAFGESSSVELSDIYANEHELALDMAGRAGIWGMEFLVIGAVLWLHQRNINLCWRPLNWIGMYSLTVFIFHKSIFVHLWGPLLLWWTARQGTILPNSFGLIMLLSATSVLLIYAFQRSGIICHLMGMHQDRDWVRLYGK